MKKLGLLIAIGTVVSVGACSDGRVTANNGSITVNTSAIGGDIQNGIDGAGNFTRNSAKALGNGLSRAGDVIENEAKAAWNELEGAARDIRGRAGDPPANTSGSKPGN